MTFVQGADRIEDLRAVCQALPWPQLANISQAASGEAASVKAIEAAGAAGVIYSVATMLAAAGAVDRMLGALKRDGDLTAAAKEELMPITRYNEVVGLDMLEAREHRYSAAAGA